MYAPPLEFEGLIPP